MANFKKDLRGKKFSPSATEMLKRNLESLYPVLLKLEPPSKRFAQEAINKPPISSRAITVNSFPYIFILFVIEML